MRPVNGLLNITILDPFICESLCLFSIKGRARTVFSDIKMTPEVKGRSSRHCMYAIASHGGSGRLFLCPKPHGLDVTGASVCVPHAPSCMLL
jgi:hypothetical protein